MMMDLQHMKQRGELRDEDIHDIKEDISDLKKTLLDPNDGVIVKVNKNTEHRENADPDLSALSSDVKELKAFKRTATRFLWIIVTAIVGVATKLMFFDD
jgi:hypothetical protein